MTREDLMRAGGARSRPGGARGAARAAADRLVRAAGSTPIGRRTALCALLAPAAAAAGCGYALAGRGSFLPSYIDVVGVPLLGNQTTFLGIEELLTTRIRDEFIGRGRYRVVPESIGVDAVLSGIITGVSVVPVGFTEQQFASRYQFTLTMNIQFRSVRTGEALWSNPAISFRGEYQLNTRGQAVVQGATFVAQERAAFDRIATDAARTVVTAILEAF